MTRVLLTAAAAAVALAAAGCGERSEVTVYKQGQYQGKPDTAPWDNKDGPFKGDKVAWEKAIRDRNNGQNEYTRSTPTAN